MSEIQTQTQRIAQKLQQLLLQQDKLRRENERIKNELSAKDSKVTELKELNAALEEKVGILQSTNGKMDDRSKKEFEKKINRYIKDIDKVISHLNT